MQEEMDTQQIQYSFRGGGGANTKGMYRAAMVYRKLEIVRDNPLWKEILHSVIVTEVVVVERAAVVVLIVVAIVVVLIMVVVVRAGIAQSV